MKVLSPQVDDHQVQSRCSANVVQRTATVDRGTVAKDSLQREIKVHPVLLRWQGLGFASAWRAPPAKIYYTNCEVRWRWSFTVEVFLLA